MRLRIQTICRNARSTGFVLLLLAFTLLSAHGTAQELEPRRWTHLPVDTNFLSVVYSHKASDIELDPVLRIEDGQEKINSLTAGYTRTFALFDKQARVDVIQGWHKGRWSGIIDGVPAETERQGFSDTIVRLAVNVVGAPPLSGKDYAVYRATTKEETIVGVGLSVQFPTGEYKDDKLINLGNNRFAFRPQVGVVQSWGNWSFEATGSAWIYTDNDSYFGGNQLEQEPLFSLQSHVTRTLLPGLWATASAGYAFGGQTTINGDQKDDRKEDLLWALTAGYAISDHWALKATYFSRRHLAPTGSDTDLLILGVSTFW